MRLKSYFSGTVEAAVELAREELGEDALLVNARPATPETRYLGAYEVVFGIGHKASDQNAAPPAPAGPWEHLAQEVAGLKREFERMAKTMVQPGVQARCEERGIPRPADLDLYARLVAQDLDPELAVQVTQGTPIEEIFEADSTLGRPGAPRAVVALIGPPGAGKTTTLIKLAARYGLASRKRAQILSADVYRIAAADQLRSLASILGIGCDIAETAGALAQMLEEHRSKDLVLIDTPGLALAEMEDAADLAHLIGSHPEVDAHLVLPASMRPADMARVIDRYSIFCPKKILFTRIDETASYGALVSASVRHSLPISFLTAGQQIPDDLEPADTSRLAELILGAGSFAPRTRGAAA